MIYVAMQEAFEPSLGHVVPEHSPERSHGLMRAQRKTHTMTTTLTTRQDCLKQWNLILDLEGQLVYEQANYDVQLRRIQNKENMALYCPPVHIGKAHEELEEAKRLLSEARTTLGQMLK